MTFLKPSLKAMFSTDSAQSGISDILSSISLHRTLYCGSFFTLTLPDITIPSVQGHSEQQGCSPSVLHTASFLPSKAAEIMAAAHPTPLSTVIAPVGQLM
jgi:hypothetical protein